MKSSLYLSALALSLSSSGAFGAEDMPDFSQIVQLSLIEGWQQEDGTRVGALKVTLAEGWKTYWRVGGDTGIPPRFDWSGSSNLASVEYLWPRPHIVDSGGLRAIGYKNELILPIRFAPETPGMAINASAQLDIGVCKDVCVPVQASISSALGTGDGTDQFLIELALADRPDTSAEAGLEEASCVFTPTEDGYRLNAEFTLPADAENTEFVVFETPNPEVWVAPAILSRVGNHLLAETSLVSYGEVKSVVDPEDLRVTIIWADRAVEFQGCAPSG